MTVVDAARAAIAALDRDGRMRLGFAAAFGFARDGRARAGFSGDAGASVTTGRGDRMCSAVCAIRSRSHCESETPRAVHCS